METAYKEGLKRDEELKKIKENLVSCFVCLCQKITYIVNGNDNTGQNYDQLTEWQTGEKFKSRAPPDCRIVAG